MGDSPDIISADKRPPVTRLSGVFNLNHLKEFHHIPQFSIGGSYEIGDSSKWEFGGRGGTTLESLGAGPLRTAYIATGTPERDSLGRITNAVIISSYYSGDSTWCYYYWFEGQPGNTLSGGPVVGPGATIDTNRFFVVFLDSLGLWGASKPSDGLGVRFPRYSIFDAVQANYRLLKDRLNIGKIRLATGVSMGAIQSYAWAIMHPDYVDAIMPIGGITSTSANPLLKWVFSLSTAAMTSDPAWRETEGNYYHLPKDRHPNKGMMFAQSILMLTVMDPDYWTAQGWDEVKKEVFSWEPQDRREGALLREAARNMDVNDLLVRNLAHDDIALEPYLDDITAETMVLHVNNDMWLRVKVAEQAAKRISRSRFASFDSPLGHYGVFSALNVLRGRVLAFFREIGLK